MSKVKSITGPLFKQRLVIKQVPDVHQFLNKRYDNDWSIYEGELKPGTYAMVGDEWRNIKKIDKDLLNHV